ncbi:MAG TPA: hypothetical protein PKY82_02585 [Pyrinomonadaceae bacterium]|nr:hypothetical protein [Pyrinomonadaceae bacterium]
MDQNLENAVEETAYLHLQKSPKLLKLVEEFIGDGLTPEQIIEICVEQTGNPYHQLAFVGCAADYLIKIRRSNL